MRIPRGFSEELRNQADIVRIVSDYVSLKKKGRDWAACCPFHNEKTPSFYVSQGKQIFKCFGCLEENELIWTKHGLKPIGEIRVGDSVLDKHGRWKEVINVIYKSSDSLLGISTGAFRYDPLWLTPDHICIYAKQADVVSAVPYIGQASDRDLKFDGNRKHTRRIWKYRNALHLTEGAAATLQVGDYLVFPVIPEEERKAFHLSASGVINPRENRINGIRVKDLPMNERAARLYGLWLAEGSVGRGFVRFTFHQNSKDTLASEVASILQDEFGLRAKIYEHSRTPNTCDVNCSKTDLALQLIHWFGRGAQYKRIPADALYWPVPVQKALLSGYRDGDADKAGLSASISRELSYGLFALAIQARENISLSRKDGYIDKTGLKHKEHWELYPRQRESLKGFYETADGATYYFTPVKAIEHSEGPKRVVDITVSETSSFTTKLATVHNCGKGGGVFDFIMEIEGCSFPEAVRIVAEKTGVTVPVETDNAREYEERASQRAELMRLNQWAAEFFEQNLIETAEGRRALDYLARRGVNEETRKAFRLGYAPNGYDAMGGHLRSRGASTTQIERSGLVTLRESGGFYDRFRNRLMFPICDAQGRVIAFGGRILGDGEPKYLNSPETTLYTKGMHLFGLSHAREAIRQRGYAILVEGYLDFLIPFQAGVRNLVASLGTALTENQARLLGRYARRIVVNFDPDSAGQAATKRSLELLLTEAFKVNVLTLPDNLDPDEYIRAHGLESYLKLLKGSQPFLDYIVDQAINSHDQTRPTGKVETINAILPYLRLVKDRIERAEHFERIADRLKIDSRLIREEFKKAAETRSERVGERAVKATLVVKLAERKLLEILINQAAVRRLMMFQMREEDYEGLRTAQLFRLIFEFEQQGVEANYHNLRQALDDEDLARDLLPGLMIGEAEKSSAQPRELELLANRSLNTLRIERLERQRAALEAEMKRFQQSGDYNRAGELTLKLKEVINELKALAEWNGQ